MSLGYNNMYNMTAGIFMTFHNKKSNKRSFSVKHSIKKMEQMEAIFPSTKYNLKTKENFILSNLYLNFKEGPSSLAGAIERLADLDDKKVLQFKNEIVNYRKFLKEDIDRINAEESKVDVEYMINEYRNSNIHWFTYYFFLEASSDPKANLEELSKSRINKMLIQKIQKLLLYVSFSESSRELIKQLMLDRIAI